MSLADFIAAQREHILEEWKRHATERIPRFASVVELRDHLGELLDAIGSELAFEGGAGGAAQAHIDQLTSTRPAARYVVVAEEHGARRAHEGILLQEMIREFPVLRSCVMRLWIGTLSATTLQDLEDARRFDDILDRALAESVSEFVNQLNQARETFLGVLGHDLRDPLSTIISGARLLRDDGLDADRSHDIIGRIVATGERMHQLIIDLLDFTRTRLGGRMPVERHTADLAPTIRNAVDEVATAHPDRRLNVDVSGDLKGNWDEKRMGQAIGNLLGNAVQHGATGQPIELSAHADEREVSIAVHNEGPPIPEDARKTLFQPMGLSGKRPEKSQDPSHLGLGLYIARAIAAGHEGTIDVSSSAEGGTTFTIRVPKRE